LLCMLISAHHSDGLGPQILHPTGSGMEERQPSQNCLRNGSSDNPRVGGGLSGP
jgi:hypothetical protein